MPQIVHLADLHLGASYDSLPADKAAACRDAQFAALTRVIDHANDHAVDAILIAGDLFDQPVPPAAVVTRTFDILSRAHAPVLIAPGNHDHLCAESPYLRTDLSANIHVYQTQALTPFELADGAVVWGAAFADQSASITLTTPPDDGRYHICLVHGDLKHPAGGYNPITVAALRASGFSYAALGHNHEYSGLRRAGNTVFACPGSLMGVGLDDEGEKGFLSGTLAPDGIRLRYLSSKAIEFHSITLCFDGIEDDTMLRTEVTRAIPAQHARICASIELTGERGYEPNLPALSRTLDQVFFYQTIHDHSVMRRDLWRYEQDDDLRGSVTRRYRALLEQAADEPARAHVLLSLRYALAALNGENPPA